MPRCRRRADMEESLHPAIISGRVAVVTGAASGIGLAAAQRLGAAGMRLVVADRDEVGLAAATAGLRDAGCEVVAQPTDVSSREAMAMLKETADGLGQVSLL